EALDGAAFQQVERLPLRQAVDHVEEDDVAEALQRCEVRQRAADHPRADERDFLAWHGVPLLGLPNAAGASGLPCVDGTARTRASRAPGRRRAVQYRRSRRTSTAPRASPPGRRTGGM